MLKQLEQKKKKRKKKKILDYNSKYKINIDESILIKINDNK